MMNNHKTNIVLTGMPASGKSTVGVILAKVLGMKFVDTDLYIQEREKALLSEIINNKGVDAFLRCEEEALLSLDTDNTVIATGGSAIYSDLGMKHLSKNALIIYLKVRKDVLLSRLNDINERGVVLKNGQTLDDMYDERILLYEKYADMVIDEDQLTIEQTVGKITEILKK